LGLFLAIRKTNPVAQWLRQYRLIEDRAGKTGEADLRNCVVKKSRKRMPNDYSSRRLSKFKSQLSGFAA